MWSVDPSYGIRYRDPRDPGQMTLDIEEEPDTAPLSRMLLDELAGAAQTLDALRDFTRRRTVYRHPSRSAASYRASSVTSALSAYPRPATCRARACSPLAVRPRPVRPCPSRTGSSRETCRRYGHGARGRRAAAPGCLLPRQH